MRGRGFPARLLSGVTDPATFATIERVFGGEVRTRTWHFRTLVSEAPMDEQIATEFAAAYAERKNIPVVYVEVV